MTIRRKKKKGKGERDGPLTPNRITQLRGKKTRNLAPVDPEAKKRKRKANTSQRRAINPKAAAKAEKKAGDQKAETSLTSIKVMEEEVAQGAKPKMTKEKKRSRPTTAKSETKAMTLIKSIERKPKEETGRKAGQSPKARKEPQKMDSDLQARSRIDLLYQRRLRRNEKRAEREAENAAEKGGTAVTGSGRGGELPGRRSIERGVETEAGPEIHREAGGPEVGATEGSTAKIGHLIEGTEEAQPKEDGEAQTATMAREKGAAGAQIPDGAGGTARPGTDGVPQGQTVQKAKKGRDPAPAPALTVTDILKLQTQRFALHRSSMYKC